MPEQTLFCISTAFLANCSLFANNNRLDKCVDVLRRLWAVFGNFGRGFGVEMLALSLSSVDFFECVCLRYRYRFTIPHVVSGYQTCCMRRIRKVVIDKLGIENSQMYV